MPKALATITGALMALALLSGCGEEQSPQSSSQSLDGAAEQPGQILESQTLESQTLESQALEGTTESQAQEATGEQQTQ